MKGIQNKKFVSGKLVVIHVSGYASERKTLKVFLFHARLKRMRRHISATMLGITRTERWLGDGSADVDQPFGLIGRQI
jgi:hypothetical protein